MVVDLADAAAATTRLQFGVYRTAALADKVIRYLNWRSGTSGAALTDPIHILVSASKEHLFIGLEGPRSGEPGYDIGERASFYLGDITPYFAGDTVPAVVCACDATTSIQNTYFAVVSRNAANNSSWVSAMLAAPAYPVSGGGESIGYGIPRLAAGNSTMYVWPYLVAESAAGLRGRVTDVFYSGFVGNGNYPVSTQERVAIGSKTYISVTYFQGSSATSMNYSAFGSGRSNGVGSPVIYIPYSG